jgi:hypothetical protein
VSTRVPASERTSPRLRELLSDLPDGEALSEVMKLGMRKIVEEALEAEVSDALGRGYYERGSEPGRGYRNGTRTGRLAIGSRSTACSPYPFGIDVASIALGGMAAGMVLSSSRSASP